VGELQRDPIDLILDDAPRPGLRMARDLLDQYRPGSLPPAKLNELLTEMEACNGADDNCKACVHQVECARAYDECVLRGK
jgi:hypothetical protein